MPRRRNLDPWVKVTISLPSTVVAEVDLALFDPVQGKTAYGARSALFTQLLRNWLQERKQHSE